MPTIGFLHTAALHTPTFARLAAEFGAASVAVVSAEALADARALGVDSAAVRFHVDAAIDELIAAGADRIVCTCSTIGGVAETIGASATVTVIRVDRPMAERALRIGGHIAVIAALESTLEPTRDLLVTVATELGLDAPTLTMHLCRDAWDEFERGDLDAYLDRIARACDDLDAAVIVLAQASMAPAAARCRTAVPVVSSPRLAVAAAAAAAR